MEKYFATYNQALALKELGFDEPCFGVFYLNPENKTWEPFRTMEESNHNKSNFSISRPLIGQVFEWFRKQGYDTKVHKEYAKLYLGFYWTGVAWEIVGNGSYEEAEELCINKLIEIVKGEKHSSSKVKTLANVNVEKLEGIQKFVDYAVTESRFNQAIENVFPNEEPIDTKKLGDVIRWVVNDVIKEEMDTMVENQVEPKEVNKYISAKVREMFFKLSV